LRIAGEDRRALRTISACAAAITGLARAGLSAFVEPLPVAREDERWAVVRSPGPLARVVSIAQALGESSARMWLKLPYCEGFDLVARATTLPILLLGGTEAAETFFAHVSAAMAAAPNVRGAMAGRCVLYPESGDPLIAAQALGAIVHAGLPPGAAIAEAAARAAATEPIIRRDP
jgi:DhnA family fructose-bisphosphate aldolase class Ia